jgi:hypothetical protein
VQNSLLQYWSTVTFRAVPTTESRDGVIIDSLSKILRKVKESQILINFKTKLRM